MYTLSDNGRAFLTNVEAGGKPRLRAYWDENGYAIAFGNHYYENGAPVRYGDVITEDRAIGMLNAHVNSRIIPYLNHHVLPEKLEQHQADSVISLMYNGGEGVLVTTGLHTAINNNPNDRQQITNCYAKIRFAKVTKEDLIGRRNKELKLYFNGDYSSYKNAYGGANYVDKDNPAFTTPVIDYFIRYANSGGIHTLQDFIDYWRLKITPDDLLSYQDNQTVMYSHYRKGDRKRYTTGVVNLIEYGTPLKIPNKANTVTSIYQLHQSIAANTPFNAFLETEVRKLLNNPKYRRLNALHTNIYAGGVYKQHIHATVLIWSRALSPDESRLIDISEFVYNLGSNNGVNGANFTLRLPKITYKNKIRGTEPRYILDKINTSDGSYFVSKMLTHVAANIRDFKFAAFNKDDDNGYLTGTNGGYLKRTNNFFNDVLQTNDLIFISYEKLDLDIATGTGRDKIEKFGTFEDGLRWVDSSVLAGNNFSFIGLIDTVSESNENNGLNVEVDIAGRDFNKVLIDDGIQFFSFTYGLKNIGQVVNGADSFASERYSMNLNKEDVGTTPLTQNITYISNQALIDAGFNFFRPHTIAEFVTYIFSKLTHMSITDGNVLFKSYKHKSFIVSSQVEDFKIDGQDQFFVTYKTIEAKGIWKICKLIIDPEVMNRKVLDPSFVTDSGSLVNYIRKVVQKPFVEFFSDTYGDKFYYIIRKPPYTESSYKSVYCINIYEDDVYDDALTYCNEVYSYYQLNPAGSVLKDPTITGNYLPAVLLPEYLQVFGNKMLKIDSNYLDFDIMDNESSNDFFEQTKKQHRHDLDYIIETTAYLPFTRMGKITLKGDPRVKKGMNIRYMATGELYHVDAVSQQVSFGSNGVESRTTTIEVSHGIVEADYEKYFKVVNLFRVYGETSDVWRVNMPVFNYLLRKRQNTKK